MSKHYEIADWLDFLRGFSTPDMQTALESHRQTCKRCQQTAQFAERLQLTANADFHSEVPAQVVRNARAIFALRPLEKIEIKPGLLARMIFDSFNQPAIQGVRSEQRSDTRHMIFEADEYVIDLRLEHERDATKVSMIGQIHHAGSADDQMIPMLITLTSKDTTLAKSRCNEFGEFAMEYLPQGSLCLRLGLAEHPEVPS